MKTGHVSILLTAIAAALSCRVTPRPPAPVSGISFNETVNAGEVVGLVLDESNHRPIQWANVYLTPSDSSPGSGAAAGAITDSVGAFRLAARSPGRYSLSARYICYRPKQLPVRLDSLAGLAVLILLSPDRILDCATDGQIKPAA